MFFTVKRKSVTEEVFYIEADTKDRAEEIAKEIDGDFCGRIIKRSIDCFVNEIKESPKLEYDEVVFQDGCYYTINTEVSCSNRYLIRAKSNNDALRIASVLHEYGSLKPNGAWDYYSEIKSICDNDGRFIGKGICLED